MTQIDPSVVDPGAAPDVPDTGGQGRAGITNDFVPRAEFEKLQGEQQRYREKWQPYERTFSQLGEERSQAFLALADLYNQDEDQAVAALKEAFGLTTAEANEVVDDAGGKPVTMDAIQQLLDDRDQAANQKAEEARWTESIRSEATAMGFTPGTRPYRELVAFARDEHGGDIKAAADALFSELDTVTRGAQAQMLEKKGQGITPVTSGDAPSGEKAYPKGRAAFGEAERRAKAFFEGRAGA